MAQSVKINNVEFRWAKLGKVAPTNRFGATQWEVQLVTSDKDTKEQLESAGIRMKPMEENGSIVYAGNAKRKSTDKNGAAKDPVRVVDGTRQPIDGDKIGNGSVGNIIVFSYEYNNNGVAGVAAQLNAVQVTKLVKYESNNSVDFDVEDMVEDTSASAGDLDFG